MTDSAAIALARYVKEEIPRLIAESEGRTKAAIPEPVAGPQGDPGVCVESITQVSDTTAHVKLTDGRTLPLRLPQAQKGIDGADGKDGADGQDGVGVTGIRGDGRRAHFSLSNGESFAVDLPRAVDGLDGERGPEGPQGPEGPPGPKPLHQWRGTQLRFELPSGGWGAFVDLRGPIQETLRREVSPGFGQRQQVFIGKPEVLPVYPALVFESVTIDGEEVFDMSVVVPE